MSYIRSGWDLRYVDGVSDDYIYPTSYPKSPKSKILVREIVDYGSISDEGIVECIARQLYQYTPDKDWAKYLVEHLASKLKVKLRNKPMSDEERTKRMWKRCEEYENNLKRNRKLSKGKTERSVEGTRTFGIRKRAQKG